MFFSLEKLVFYQDHCQSFFLINFAVKSERKKVQIFDQNHGLTPLQKTQIFQLPNMKLFVEGFFSLKCVAKDSFFINLH